MSQRADTDRTHLRLWAATGSRHDKMIKTLQVILPMAIGVLAAVLVFAPFTQRSEIGFLLSKDKVAMAQERMRVTRALYRGSDAKGQPFALSAASAVQRSSADPVVAMMGLSAAIRLADGPATLTADTGRYHMDSETVDVVGPLQLTSADGYRLDTGDVTVDLKARTMGSSARVSGTMPIGQFAANRLFVDLDGRIVRLDGAARLTINQGVLK